MPYVASGSILYIYPTAAYTYDNVYSGETSIKGTRNSGGPPPQKP